MAACTPAARDLIGPYCDALRAQSLKVGLYFSHLDWSHPDYAPVFPAERTWEKLATPAWLAQFEGGRIPATLDVETYRQGWPEGPATPDWQRFLQFRNAQLEELCTRYAPDLLWFDGDWTPEASYWNMPALREQLHRMLPKVVLNSRMAGCGDYETPEQGLPITPPSGPWEFCMTMNDSWGYKEHDRNYKSARQIIRTFAECIGMGGNLLLDAGPRADGTIPPEQVERLETLGAWIGRHEEAVYGTVAGLPPGYAYGATTLSADRRSLYVFNFDRPYDEVAVKGINARVSRVSVLGRGTEVAHRTLGGAPWANVPGVLWISVPEQELDPYATVLKIDLQSPLDQEHCIDKPIERI